MTYRFFEGEKQFYKGFIEANGNFVSIGNVFLEGGQLELRFKCPKCNWVIKVEDQEILCPKIVEPISMSDNVSGDFAICEKCGENYEISIFSGLGGLSVSIDSLPKEWKFFF